MSAWPCLGLQGVPAFPPPKIKSNKRRSSGETLGALNSYLSSTKRTRWTPQDDVVLADALHATYSPGWHNWITGDRGINGAIWEGSEPLLSAGTWTRNDPEGAAERREAEEKRGEEDSVRTSTSPFKLTVITFTFLSVLWHSCVSVPQEAEEWAAGGQTKGFHPATWFGSPTVHSLPQDSGPDLRPGRSLRGVPVSNLQQLPYCEPQNTRVEMYLLWQAHVSVTSEGGPEQRSSFSLY